MRNIKFDFSGQVVLVTGGVGAIGSTLADAFVEAGAVVYIAGRTSNIESLSDREFIKMDVKSSDSVRECIDHIISASKRIDIVVTASGLQIRKPALDFNEADWDDVIKTNLYGSFFVAQEVARQMVKNNYGRIIFITSLTAEIGIPNMVAYVSSRGGIKQLSKALAVELAEKGITVNCIGPGRFKTSMTEDVFNDPELKESFLRLIPQNRPGVPDDLVGAALFLASYEAGYITGETIYVDGGWLAGGGNCKT